MERKLEIGSLKGCKKYRIEFVQSAFINSESLGNHWFLDLNLRSFQQ